MKNIYLLIALLAGTFYSSFASGRPADPASAKKHSSAKSFHAGSTYFDKADYLFQFNGSPAGALDFGGANDYADLGVVLAANASYTREAWIRNTNAGSLNNIFSTNADPIYIPGGRINVGHSGNFSVIVDPTPIPLNTWIHMAVTYDQPTSTLSLYVNGVLKGRTTSAPAFTGGVMYLGKHPGGGGTSALQMDEVRFWNRALCQGEIVQYKNQELPFTSGNGLIAYYKMNQGAVNTANGSLGTTLESATGTNNGTLVGFSLTGTSSNWIAGNVSGTALLFTPPQAAASATGPTTFCMGGSVVLNANSGTGLTYQWYKNNAAIPGANAISYSATATGSYHAVINDNGCSAVTNTIPVLVNPLPILSVTSNSPLAVTTGLQLNASGAVTYSWTGPNNFSAGTAVASRSNVTLSDAGTYTVNGTDANNCEATASVVVAINATPAQALHFDGQNDWVNVTSIPAINAIPVTLEAMVKPELRTDAISNGFYPNNILSNDIPGRFGLGFGANVFTLNGTTQARITLEFKNGFREIINPAGLVSGQWIHLAVVYNNGNVKTYVNGLLVDNFNYAQAPLNGNTFMYIGKHNNDGGYLTRRFFKGAIDEVRVWNRALCDAEIIAQSGCQLQGAGNGLVANYNFDQGIAGANNSNITGLYDVKNNAFTGTLTDGGVPPFTLTGTASNWIAPGGTNGTCSPYTVGDINVQGNNTTIYDGTTVTSAGNFTFLGTTAPGVSVTRTFTIHNTGTGPLNINSIQFTGAQASSYSYSGISLPLTIAAGSSTTVSISCNSNSVGSKTATINIDVTDCDESNYDFALSTTVTCAAIGTATTVTDPTCNGLSDGSISVAIPVTGQAPFAYSINGGANYTPGNVFSSLGAGNYSVLIKDANGCTSAARAITLSQPPSLIFTTTKADLSCAGENSGSITVHSQGGTGAIQYALQGGAFQAASQFTGLAAGSYSIAVKDANGCIATGSQTLVVTDNIPPVSPPIAEARGECSVTVTAPVATDNCTGAIEGTTSDPLVYTTQGSYQITWSFTDASGNTATATQTVVVKDVTPPVISCPATQELNLMADCSATLPDYRSLLVVNDNCNAGTLPVIIQTPAPGSPVNGQGNIMVTFAVSDVANNISNCNMNVLKKDVTAPSITCAPVVSVNAIQGRCDATVIITTPAVTDNCSALLLGNALNFDGNDIAKVLSTSAINANQGKRTVEVWFKVNDKNISNRKQVIWEEGAFVNGLNLYVFAGKLYVGMYSETRNFDGNWISTSAISSGQWHNAVLVFDGTAPVNSRIKGYLDGVLFGTAASSTNVLNEHPGENAVGGMFNGGKFHDGDVQSTPELSNFFTGDIDEIRLWTIARTETELAANVYKKLKGNEPGLTVYYDFDQGTACGNNNGINFLDDKTNTNLNGTFSGFNTNGSTGCISNWTNGAPALTSSITLTNNYTNSASASSTYPVGTTNITWTAKDEAGNISTCTQQVTVRDIQAPVISCPANIIINATSAAGAVVNYSTPVGTDNCGGAATVRLSGFASGETFPIGTTTVIHEVTDAAGLKTQCSFAVTITGLPPAIVCPENIVVSNATGDCGAIVPFSAGETQAIPASVITYSHQPGSLFPVGTTTVRATATNAVGTSECTFTVTVNDTEKPLLTGIPHNQTVNCQSIPEPPPVTASDNCGLNVPVQYEEVKTAGNCANNYTLTRTWTITDLHGNMSTASQVITVQDVTAPVINCPEEVTLNCQQVTEPVFTGMATATDNCGTASVSYSDVSTRSADVQNPAYYNYVITRTWKAVDVCGNASTCTQTITVRDVTAPLIACADNKVVSCEGDKSTSANGIATATDNCSPVSIIHNDISTQSADVHNPAHYNYVITRTWSAADVSGNRSECVQTITVRDITAPLINCPVAVTLNCQDENGSAATGMATATDNCSPVTITQSDASTRSNDPTNPAHYNYVITRTWSAADVSGNASTCTQTITIRDITAPVARCKPLSITLINGVANITPQLINDASSDQCSPVVSLSVSKGSFNCNNLGTNKVILTATDPSGNSATCEAIVTVVGEVPTCSITSVPQSSVYTGGNVNNLFLGYGAQSTTLQLNVPASGAPYTYKWTGTGPLSSYSVQSPVFTPVAAGSYTFRATVTNRYGCTTTCTITICVTDVRVLSKKDGGTWDGKKVYVCHVPPGNPGNSHTLEISINAVAAHIGTSGHGSDRLGQCEVAACGTAIYSRNSVPEVVERSASIMAYPNPTTGTFALQLQNYKGVVEVQVLDIYGKLISGRQVSVSSQSHNMSIDLSRHAAGIYHVRVNNESSVKTLKVVVAR